MVRRIRSGRSANQNAVKACRKPGRNFADECFASAQSLRTKKYIQLSTGRALVLAAQAEANEWIAILLKYASHMTSTNFSNALKVMKKLEDANRVFS